MELIRQNKQEPNCFAVSAVMVLRHQLEKTNRYMALSKAHLEGLLKKIGHRGQEVLWEKADGNQKLKGIHPQEVIDWYTEFGYTLWLLERFPRSAPQGFHNDARMVWDGTDADARFWKILDERAGIIITSSHAVAWDGKNFFDPNGSRFPESVFKRQAIEAWLICRL